VTITRESLTEALSSFVEDCPQRSTFTLHDAIGSLTALSTPVAVEHVVAVLCDLVEEGRLAYGSDARFHITCARPRLLLAV
jgi:hypothetical protein